MYVVLFILFAKLWFGEESSILNWRMRKWRSCSNGLFFQDSLRLVPVRTANRVINQRFSVIIFRACIQQASQWIRLFWPMRKQQHREQNELRNTISISWTRSDRTRILKLILSKPLLDHGGHRVRPESKLLVKSLNSLWPFAKCTGSA